MREGTLLAKDPDFLGQIREVARPTVMDIVLLMLTGACFVLIVVATRFGWEPSGYAFCGAVAFSMWILNVVNRVIGTMRRMHDRIRRLEREIENLVYDRDREREAQRDLPEDMRN